MSNDSSEPGNTTVQRRYYINETTGLSRSDVSDMWLRLGYREVTRAEWQAYRRDHPEPGTYVVYLNGPTRRMLQQWARKCEAGVKPQECARWVIENFMAQHKETGGEFLPRLMGASQIGQ